MQEEKTQDWNTMPEEGCVQTLIDPQLYSKEWTLTGQQPLRTLFALPNITKKVNLYSTLLRPVSKALRYSPCVTLGPHSFICHPHTNHTCLYSSAATRRRPLAGTHCAYPRRDGQVELTWVAGYISSPHRELNPDMVTYRSANGARRRLTSLIETNALPLCQTTTDNAQTTYQ